MGKNNLPLELTPAFLNVMATVKRKVSFDPTKNTFVLPAANNRLVNEEYVENLLTEEMAKTELHYDEIGEEEFGRLLEFAMKTLEEGHEGDRQEEERPDVEVKASKKKYIEDDVDEDELDAAAEEEAIEVEEEDEQDVSDEEDDAPMQLKGKKRFPRIHESVDADTESPEVIHFDFISEVINEVKANPDTDTDYLLVRIRNGLKTKGIQVNYT